MIKTLLKQYINNALHKITKNDVSFDIRIPSKEFGDYSSNIGLVLCKQLHQSPQDINLRLINILNKSKDFTKYFSQIQEANGFLNFTLNPKFVHQEIKNINKQKEKYFMVKNSTKKKPKVQVEFVSANPTGPLTLANARAAFYGKALADILSYNGFQVEKEFYVNNTGKQIYNLGIAIIKA
jgi:arginyl-tRNA synthetase